MGRIIDAGLRDLSTIIHKMNHLAYQAVSMAIHESLNDGDLYDRIKDASDILILLADQVEDKVFEIIVRFQPVASDLREIKSYMKISYDLARIGRYALDISHVNKLFGGLKKSEEWIRSHTANMGIKVLDMMKISIEALEGQKPEIARSVSEIENFVDELYLNFLDKIIYDKNIENKIIVSSVLTIRYLERIADHVAYICESIIYTLTGKKEILR